MERRIFWLLSVAVVGLAFLLREQYVLQVVVLNPFNGDASSYVRYAQNILLGYFGSGATPDAYRPPGYPALIAIAQSLGGDWYHRLLQWQVLMGTATVALTIALGRQWLPMWGALLAGLLLALWPHHITFSAEVLTEILCGFLLTTAVLTAAVAKNRKWIWACAGVLFACASMVNTVCLLLPLVIGAVLIGRKAPARWFALLVPTILIVGGWSMRPVDAGSDRVWQNLVQGSRPMYHDSYMNQLESPAAAKTNKEIQDEATAAVAHPAQGLELIWDRLSRRPAHYLAWYASKSWLLWDWDIRIRSRYANGPHVHAVALSTLEAAPLRQVSTFLRFINPLLFALSLAFAIYAAMFSRGLARMVGLAFLYFTAIHVVLQAEPRYSIPYRPLQMLLVAGALAWISTTLRPTNSRATADRDAECPEPS